MHTCTYAFFIKDIRIFPNTEKKKKRFPEFPGKAYQVSDKQHSGKYP